MGRLNKNNFLRWDGEFNEIEAHNNAVNDAVSMTPVVDSIEIDILANDTSTFGVDFSSIVITAQDNVTHPATWNPTSKKITYNLSPGGVGVHTIKYKWSDVYGNLSNEATVSITVTARATAWRVYPSSYQCQLDGDSHRTGLSLYTLLQEYYTDDSSNVMPTSTKPNVDGDPDYVAPAVDSGCAPESETNDFLLAFIINGEDTTGICLQDRITHLYTGGSDTILDVGVRVWKNSALNEFAVAGSYSDGDHIFQVSGSVIYSSMPCT